MNTVEVGGGSRSAMSAQCPDYPTDEYLADYLRRHFDERHDELRAAVEQRLADR